METINLCRFIGETFLGAAKIDSGLAPNYYYLSKELLKNGVQTTILCRNSGAEEEREEVDGIQIARINAPQTKFNSAFFHLPFGIEAFKESKKFDKDIFQLHNFYGYWFQNFIKEPNVLTIHGSDIRMYTSTPVWPMEMPYQHFRAKFDLWRTTLESKKMCRHATHVVGVSRAVREELILAWKIKNISTIHNGINLKEFKKTKKSNIFYKYGNSFNIIYVGRVTPSKALKYAFSAVDEIKNAKLFIVGDVSGINKRYFDILTKDMKNKERIVIFGKVKHSELPKYYSSADCMVFPTLSEGFPKVLIEAMACECPVIATNIPGNNEILNNTTGYPVEPNNSEQIRDAILRVMQNPGEAKQKAKKAAGIVKTKFTWEEAAKKYAQLYKKLLL